MIRIAIVEDDASYRKQITEYLERYENENKEKIELSVFKDGDEIIENYKPAYDIILLDIQMQFVDGITAARQIRAVDPDVIIIFITTTPQYAIQGYEVDALDYVLKPVNYFALSQRLNRAVERMNKRRTVHLMI